MSLDLALRLLWREATREDIIAKLEERRYYVPRTAKVHEKRKVWAKTKRRRRQARRKVQN
jgi:ribosomal protein S21